jgi:GntR family transcriptional regulator
MGTFLKRLPHLHNPIDEAIDFCEVIARNGRKPGRRYLKAAVETPAPAIADALCHPDQPALVRHTVFTADDDPVIYCVNTFPLAVVPLPLAERVVADPALSEPLYDFMERECGERIEYHRSTIWPALAADCDLLEPVCHPLAPVIVIDEIGFSAAARPVVHSREVYPDAFMRFEMIRRRGLRS